MTENIQPIVQKAINTIEGFEEVHKVLLKNTIIHGKSKSTFNNYIRKIAIISLHFRKLPVNISDAEIQDFLADLAVSSISPSISSFKHMVFGLLFYFRNIGLNERALSLPKIKKEYKLPIIINRTELKELFDAPKALKHRLILRTIYSAGLRSSEVINIKISDIDFERKSIHIHQSKNKKDRILPLSIQLAAELKSYLHSENPKTWLFNARNKGEKYTRSGICWIMRESLRKTGIIKKVNLHSLRHSYATHLLEEGVDIMSLKQLLGHSHVSTTMIYLQVTRMHYKLAYSPYDSLFK